MNRIKVLTILQHRSHLIETVLRAIEEDHVGLVSDDQFGQQGFVPLRSLVDKHNLILDSGFGLLGQVGRGVDRHLIDSRVSARGSHDITAPVAATVASPIGSRNWLLRDSVKQQSIFQLFVQRILDLQLGGVVTNLAHMTARESASV